MASATTKDRDQAQTLPALLMMQAERFGRDRVALREKEYGVWQAVTWQQYLEHVRDFSLGLIALGFEPGEALGIIGDNRPEWIYAELAAQAAQLALAGPEVRVVLSDRIERWRRQR